MCDLCELHVFLASSHVSWDGSVSLLCQCLSACQHLSSGAIEPGQCFHNSVPEPSSLAGSEVLKCSGAVELGRFTVRCLSGPLSLAGKYVADCVSCVSVVKCLFLFGAIEPAAVSNACGMIEQPFHKIARDWLATEPEPTGLVVVSCRHTSPDWVWLATVPEPTGFCQ